MTDVRTHAPEAAAAARLHHLDALRGVAMLLGIVLHAALSFFPGFWPTEDDTASWSGPYDEILHGIHGFRMPLFFLLSGFFTAMLWRRRGLGALIEQRAKRVALPLAIGMVTIIPLMNWVSDAAVEDRIDDLLTATYLQKESVVDELLADGVDPEQPRGETGESPLHAAAVFGDVDIAAALLDAGASPVAPDFNGDTPLAWAFFAGSAEVADLLVAAGHPEIRPAGVDWEDLSDWGFGAESLESDDVALESWVSSLHHLWFLWFILLLVAGFALVAVVADRFRGREPPVRIGRSPTGWVMWALVPLTLAPQLLMGDRGAVRAFGPDTSATLVPEWRVLAYYAVFFAFGALAYDRTTASGRATIDAVGRWWFVVLPVGLLVVFPVGLDATFEGGGWLAASVLQVVYAWAMIVGLLGLFGAVLAVERRGVRYLSDSAYWLYLAHLPLVIWLQWQVTDWDLPSGVKFVGINVVTVAVLLASYQLFVRYTPIGTMLNGARTRPSAATPPGDPSTMRDESPVAPQRSSHP